MKEIVSAIHLNGKFKNNKIYKPHLTDRRGIRLVFPDNTECILWTNGIKYYAICECFGTSFTVNIPQRIGDDIWQRFKDEHDGKYTYQDL